MKYALEVTGITKQFTDKGKEFYALKDVGFNIKPGEVYGLLGPNGAGKTTIMNVIIGSITQDKGTVTVLGEPNSNVAVFDRVNGISAETRFHWALKPPDILRFYAKVYGLKKDAAEKRIKELKEMFELADVWHSKTAWLSTGERARLAFAKSMINDPELLLYDEPTLGLDPNIAVKVRQFIRHINKDQKKTILLTSHYMQEVELLAHRVGFISKGQIVDTGDIETVKLKHFSTYDVWIRPKTMITQKAAKELGFQIKGSSLFREMEATEDMSIVLGRLHKKGIEVADIKIKKPSLEDYFIKLAK
ncbi:ABC transporter ATP-binding protein [Candidatus Woesearchaeota archaeon]|nr:ABC transporter ATP-binding protein [Candidatus Woesearchaeota archaeon]